MNDKASRTHSLKLALYMTLMGILVWWTVVLAIPVAIEWEIPQSTANRLPVYGFFIGIALGLGMGLSAAIERTLLGVIGFGVLGGVLWFFSVIFVGGALIFVGVPEDTVDGIMDWLGPAAFCIGILLGGIVAFAIIHDKLDTLLARFRTRRHKVP